MATSKLPWIVLATAFSAGVLGMVACKSAGPDAPARKNGCIDTSCGSVTTAAPPSTTDAGTSNGATTRALDPFADEEDVDDDAGGPGLP